MTYVLYFKDNHTPPALHSRSGLSPWEAALNLSYDILMEKDEPMGIDYLEDGGFRISHLRGNGETDWELPYYVATMLQLELAS